jgi:hypothetical protein
VNTGSLDVDFLGLLSQVIHKWSNISKTIYEICEKDLVFSARHQRNSKKLSMHLQY